MAPLVATHVSNVAAPSFEAEAQPEEPVRLSVLIVDDDQDCRDALEGAVTCLGYTCKLARDGLEAWQMYERERADVILSDWKMPGMNGYDLCRKIRSDDSGRPYTHFIFITGNDDKKHFIEGMHAGADDYIAKPVDLDELEARLEAAKRVVLHNRQLTQDNSTLRHDSERAHVAARTDPLTEAFNRLALKEDLEALAGRAVRYGHKYCAALCDIDEFKAYNDHFGHLPGDEVLRRIARTFHDTLRRGDVFYRYGGEEFLVILPEQPLQEGARGMERVRQVIERLAIPHAPRAKYPVVTMSVGISALTTEKNGSIEEWLWRADAALYLAKARGRNRVEVEGSG
jgi:two-component system cell cycle response regulator